MTSNNLINGFCQTNERFFVILFGLLDDKANILTGLQEGAKVLDLHHTVEKLNEFFEEHFAMLRLFKKGLFSLDTLIT